MVKQLLINGYIYTVDGNGWENAPAHSMAIDDKGRICAIGDEKETLVFALLDVCPKAGRN